MKEGHGKYIWSDGSVYDGEWKDNTCEGLGTYIWKDGRLF